MKKFIRTCALSFLSSLFLAATYVPFLLPVSPRAEGNADNGKRIIRTASNGDEADTLAAAKAVDGDFTTRWASTVGIAEKYLEFEYAEAQTLYGMRILWERRNVESYKIEVAESGEGQFVEVYRSDRNSGQIDEVVNFTAPVSAKKVKITVLNFVAQAPDINLNSVSWETVSIFEAVGLFSETAKVQVAPDNENIALNKTISYVDTDTSAASEMPKAVDGSTDTAWTIGNGTHFFKVDLGALYSLRSFNFYWQTANAYPYELYSSVDGSVWVKQYIHTPGNQSSAWRQKEVFNWDTNTQARYFAVKFNPANVSKNGTPALQELAIYSNRQEVPSDSLNNIRQLYLNDDVSRLSLPLMENGEVRILNTSDLPVIATDGTVNKPLLAKTVKVFLAHFNSDGALLAKKEFSVNVPGLNDAQGAGNYKLPIVPPVQQFYTDGNFTSWADTVNVASSEPAFGFAVDEFIADAKSLWGNNFIKGQGATSSGTQVAAVTFEKVDNLNLGKEGYVIKIEADKITVQASEPAGLYFATRSLLQLEANKLPLGAIKDYPLYPVRGFMLDVGRKFIPIPYIKEIINNMAFFKLNDLQLHLNDNNIWLHRVSNNVEEILERSEAGFRIETGIVGANGKKLTSKDHYTKAEFIELVQYAKERGVTIIPEIDSPGHALALTQVRPDLYYKGTLESGKNNVERAAMLDLSNPESIAFVKQIFDELIGTAEAPGPFYELPIIHIGADEYYGDTAAYLKFLEDMLTYIREKGKVVRFWGSLSVKKGQQQFSPENVAASQLHLWSEYYNAPAKAKELGFKVINITDRPTYSVPDGTYSVGNGYKDFISLPELFKARPYIFSKGRYDVSDPDVLGNGFAIWNDHNCDVIDKGLTSHDIFLRFIQPLPYSAFRGWIDDNNLTFEQFKAQAEAVKVPRSNPYFQATKQEEGTFKQAWSAWVANPKAEKTTNLDVLSVDHNLKLNITFNSINNGQKWMSNATSTVWWKDNEGYFAYDFEGRHIQFDFQPQPGVPYAIRIQNREQNLILEVNGQKINKRPHPVKTELAHTTLLLPVAKLEAVDASISDSKLVYDRLTEDSFIKNSEIANKRASSAETVKVSNGIENAFDDNPQTVWHTAWSKNGPENNLPFTVEVDFKTPQRLEGFHYLGRAAGGDNGRILRYKLYIKKAGADAYEAWSPEQNLTIKDREHLWRSAEATEPVESVKIEILDAFNGFASAAEFKFLAAAEPEIEPTEPETTTVATNTEPTATTTAQESSAVTTVTTISETTISETTSVATTEAPTTTGTSAAPTITSEATTSATTSTVAATTASETTTVTEPTTTVTTTSGTTATTAPATVKPTSSATSTGETSTTVSTTTESSAPTTAANVQPVPGNTSLIKVTTQAAVTTENKKNLHGFILRGENGGDKSTSVIVHKPVTKTGESKFNAGLISVSVLLLLMLLSKKVKEQGLK